MSIEHTALILVGGKGTRLAEVTGGSVSKGMVPIDKKGEVTGIEYVSRLLDQLGVHDVVLCAKHFADQYGAVAREKHYTIVNQTGETGTSGAIEEVIEKYGYDKSYLVMSVDTYVSKKDLKTLLEAHRDHTITWAVAPYQYDAMSGYYGLVVKNKTHAIIGDCTTAWWKNWDLTDTSLYVKGAIQVIDPRIYLRGLELLKRFCKKDYPIDLYWDTMPILEEMNRRNIIRGKPSVLQAVVFTDPLIDYGTPERLKLTRELFDQLVYERL